MKGCFYRQLYMEQEGSIDPEAANTADGVRVKLEYFGVDGQGHYLQTTTVMIDYKPVTTCEVTISPMYTSTSAALIRRAIETFDNKVFVLTTSSRKGQKS